LAVRQLALPKGERFLPPCELAYPLERIAAVSPLGPVSRLLRRFVVRTLLSLQLAIEQRG
jgi:hypothetical protein